MLPNENNPKCPECGGITHKTGFIVNRTCKKQKYHCRECGLNFSGEI